MTTERDEIIFGVSLFAPMIIFGLMGCYFNNVGIGITGAVIGILLAKLELVFGVVQS